MVRYNMAGYIQPATSYSYERICNNDKKIRSHNCSQNSKQDYVLCMIIWSEAVCTYLCTVIPSRSDRYRVDESYLESYRPVADN